MIRFLLLAIVTLSAASTASAFVPSLPMSSETSLVAPTNRIISQGRKSSSLSMALEGQSPQLRKNVMAATVSVFAMPAISSALTAAIPALVATQGTSTLLQLGNDPRVLLGLFLAHWYVTNYFLQKYPDVGEVMEP